MRKTLRSFTALLLAVTVAVTSLAVGAARGQADPVGTMVLCTGSGAVEVPVGADGQPTGHAHVCPDCVLTFFAAVESAAAAPARVLRVARIGPASRRAPVLQSVPVGWRARGPPAA